MVRIGFILIVLQGFLAFHGFAQTEVGDGEPSIVYRSDQAFGGGFYAKGYFLDYHYGKRITATLNQKFHGSFSNLRHQKETKSFNPFFKDARGYYFGKLNAFWQLKLGYGFQKIITPKLQKHGVAISASFLGGVSLGMLKPVYLEIIKEQFVDSVSQGVLVTEQYTGVQGREVIYGRAPWFMGIGEMKFQPGVFVRQEFEFEYSAYKETIQSITAGMELQYYPSEIEIMTMTENSRIFARLFIGFKIGNRKK